MQAEGSWVFPAEPAADTAGADRAATGNDRRFLLEQAKVAGVIGVFDSGFGGLTVLKALTQRLGDYDYLYLGDSARTPHGISSHETVTAFTRQAVDFLFAAGCPLVILACNTASARALRTLQQRHLPVSFPDRRLLGVVRPSVEALAGLPPGAIPGITQPAMVEGAVAVLGTTGTVASNSYGLELAKLAPRIRLVQKACPLWVPLVEAGEIDSPGARHFLHQYLDPLFADVANQPSRVLLGCTHYPLLMAGIRAIVPPQVAVLSQGPIVAERLEAYLGRHPDMNNRLGRNGRRRYVTTDDPTWFAEHAAWILEHSVDVEKVELG